MDRLRPRYGVSGGLTLEPKVAKIRTGRRVAISVASLKAFNEDLNTLKVYAHAHDELDKLFGQSMLDTPNRLPGLLKRKYLDYFDKKSINLNQPRFETLCEFGVHKLNLMASDYTQSFLNLTIRIEQVGLATDIWLRRQSSRCKRRTSWRSLNGNRWQKLA